MKTTKLIAKTKSIFIGALAIMILFSFSSCTRKISFLTSSVVPAARGNIEVSKDKNNNYIILVSVTNLAEVERLQPMKKNYVVWVVTEQDLTSNIGQVTSIANKLTATLSTVSPFKPVKVFITAEDEAGVQFPGAMLVLSTDKF